MKDNHKTRSLTSLNCDDFGTEIGDLRRFSSVDNVSKYPAQLERTSKLQKVRSVMTMTERLEKTTPYNIFCNCLDDIPETYEQLNAIHFHGKYIQES